VTVRVAVRLAGLGLIALIVALLTGSTAIAVLVVALAVAGIVKLLRDWRAEPAGIPAEGVDVPVAAIGPDQFAPDISTNPDGPSSDARED